MNNSYITIIKEKRTALSRKRIPLNQNECTTDFRIGVPFEQNLHLRVQVIWKNHFIQDTGNHLCFVVFIGNKAVGKFIVIATTVLTSEPADHQAFLYSTFLFTDAWTGVPVTEHSLTDRA